MRFKKISILLVAGLLLLSGCSSPEDAAMATCIEQWAISEEASGPLVSRSTGAEVTPEELCEEEQEQAEDFVGFWSDPEKWEPVQEHWRQ